MDVNNIIQEWQHRTKILRHASGAPRAVCLEFDSAAHFVAECERLNVHCKVINKPQVLQRIGRKFFYGVAGTRERTLELVRVAQVPDGLANDAEKIEKEIEHILFKRLKKSKSAKAYRTLAGVGGSLNYGRYFSGIPDCFNRVKREKPTRLIRIGISFGMAFEADQFVFSRMAALATATSRALERMGYSSEIMAYQNTWGQIIDRKTQRIKQQLDFQFNVRFPVKDTDKSLDLGKLSVVSLPGLLRDYCFGCQDALGQYYGLPVQEENGYGNDGPGLSPQLAKDIGVDIQVAVGKLKNGQWSEYIRTDLDILC